MKYLNVNKYHIIWKGLIIIDILVWFFIIIRYPNQLMVFKLLVVLSAIYSLSYMIQPKDLQKLIAMRTLLDNILMLFSNAYFFPQYAQISIFSIFLASVTNVIICQNKILRLWLYICPMFLYLPLLLKEYPVRDHLYNLTMIFALYIGLYLINLVFDIPNKYLREIYAIRQIYREAIKVYIKIDEAIRREVIYFHLFIELVKYFPNIKIREETIKGLTYMEFKPVLFPIILTLAYLDKGFISYTYGKLVIEPDKELTEEEKNELVLILSDYDIECGINNNVVTLFFIRGVL